MRLLHSRSLRTCFTMGALLVASPLLWGQTSVLGPNAIEKKGISKVESQLHRINGEQRTLIREQLHAFDLRGNLTGKDRYVQGTKVMEMDAGFNAENFAVFRAVETPQLEGNNLVSWSHTVENGRTIRTQDDRIGLIRTYAYDAAGRITRVETQMDADMPPFSVETFAYTANGSLKKRVHESPIMTETFELSYDAQGRKTRACKRSEYDVAGEQDKQITETYSYGAQGMLTQISRYDRENKLMYAIAYSYNEKGLLISKTSGNSKIVYVRDANGLILEQQRYRGEQLTMVETYTYQFWQQTAMKGIGN